MQSFYNCSLKNLNTFGIDVIAQQLIILESAEDIKIFIESEKYACKKTLILGGGSNVLFLNDYDGIVLQNNCKGIKIIDKTADEVIVEANAGELWDDLVTFCVNNEFYGIENLQLIPGKVGAAPIQNIGAYGAELKDCFVSLDGINLITHEEKEFISEECQFGYRDSIFKKELMNKFLITKIRLKLSLHKKLNLSYKVLKEELKNKDENEISIYDVSSIIKRIRKSKLPDISRFGNAGSFFKNVEVNSKIYEQLKEKFSDIVAYKLDNGNYKLASAWLIEQCGYKGKQKDNVGCYELQPLVLINYGNASGWEIKKFSEEIQKAVFNKFGVEIIPEVNFIY